MLISEEENALKKENSKDQFKCDKCDWTSRFEPALKGHMRRVHAKKINNVLTIPCHKCNLKLTSMSAHKMHLKSCQKVTPKKRVYEDFNCQICDFVSKDKSMLEKHMTSDHGNSLRINSI